MIVTFPSRRSMRTIIPCWKHETVRLRQHSRTERCHYCRHIKACSSSRRAKTTSKPIIARHQSINLLPSERRPGSSPNDDSLLGFRWSIIRATRHVIISSPPPLTLATPNSTPHREAWKGVQIPPSLLFAWDLHSMNRLLMLSLLQAVFRKCYSFSSLDFPRVRFVYIELSYDSIEPVMHLKHNR